MPRSREQAARDDAPAPDPLQTDDQATDAAEQAVADAEAEAHQQ